MKEVDFGPLSECDPPTCGHPVGNGAVVARASSAGVHADGGRIDAFVAVAGRILRTSAPACIQYGLGFVRRIAECPALRLEHVIFAPERARPILLGHVTLYNRSNLLLVAQYSELWDLDCEQREVVEGACIVHTARGRRILADAGAVVRAHAPESLAAGMALDLRVPVPPDAQRSLSFAYALPSEDDEPAALVRAWRGRVESELEDAVAVRRRRCAASADPLAKYRAVFPGG